jgi:phage terminase large subunit-like protein
MFATEGNVVDYDAIRKQIVSDYSRFAIRQVRYDRWGATQLSTQLSGEDGLEMVTMGQGFASMSSPMKEFMRQLLDKGIAHGGHPVLRWQASNVMARMDPAGNVKMDKAASRERIDGMVSAVMALDGIIREPASVYDEGGIKIL